MDKYITLYNSITGAYHSMPFNQEEIESVIKTPIYLQSNSNELVSLIYQGLTTNQPGLFFTASLSYLLKSETYKIGEAMGSNSYYIYVSRGDGFGFCRFCGSDFQEDINQANDRAPLMIDTVMKMFRSTNSKGNGSNFTKPKKKRK